MKTLYFDLFSGVSGDMFIAALLDLGVEFAALERELAKLGVSEFHLHARRDSKCSIAGTKFDVHLRHEHGHEHSHGHEHGEGGHDHGHAHEHGHGHHDHHHHAGEHERGHSQAPEHSHDEPHDGHDHEHGHHDDHGRSFAEISRLIDSSGLSAWVKSKAIAVFRRIALAEGQIHGVPAEDVHFHEVGAVDSIVDIVGACICLELLECPRVLASRVIEGSGFVCCAHGRFPIPAPATLAILGHRGIAVTQCDEPHELVTPTGAALIAEFAESFGPMSGLVATRIGIGLGTRDNVTRPNVLRAVLSDQAPESSPAWESDSVAVLESNIDDCPGEVLGNFLERAMEMGALDAFFTPTQMKKNRPGVLVTVVCAPADADRLSELVLRETTAFGVRRSVLERRKLAREFIEVKTEYGSVKVKIGRLGKEVVQVAPEFDDCRMLARASNVPVRTVMDSARIAGEGAMRGSTTV